MVVIYNIDIVHLLSTMLNTNSRLRATLSQVIMSKWVGGSVVIGRRESIDPAFVEEIISSSVTQAGGLLMNELTLKLSLIRAPPSFEEQSNSSHTSMDELGVVDKGKVWWRRVLKSISTLGQPSVHAMPLQVQQQPLLTRIFRRRVATASAFDSNQQQCKPTHLRRETQMKH
jgi:hypothetical protein